MNWKVVSLVLAAILLAWFIQARISQHYDGQRFAEADRKKQVVFDELMQSMGAPITIKDQKRCYQSQQGPFDNGRLWCETSSAGYFAEPIPMQEITGKFESIFHEHGWNGMNDRRAEFEFEGAKDIPCELIIKDGVLAQEPGSGLPGEIQSKQTVIISCSDRAKAKHYDYIDY